jgi:hypothetical protein
MVDEQLSAALLGLWQTFLEGWKLGGARRLTRACMCHAPCGGWYIM